MDNATIDATVDNRMADIAAVLGFLADPGDKNKDALPPRQILVIQKATYISAGYIAAAGAAPDGQFNVLVTGTPTASSSVTRGYLRFVPNSAIRKPTFDARTDTINLWLDIAGMAMTLEQLKHPDRFLWIGWFAGGHVYSDIHTAP